MLDFCSVFSKNAYFGGYPSQEEFKALINEFLIEQVFGISVVNCFMGK